MTSMELNSKERVILEHLISASPDARQVMRAYALIWLDEGEPVDEIAQRLGISRQSVYNWALRVQQRDDSELHSRLADAPRSGRPCTAKGGIDSLVQEVIDTDPRQLGYRSTVWTAPLLVSYLSREQAIEVSADSVSRALTRLRIKWKRPRPQLGLRSPTWRQAKGGCKMGFSASRARSYSCGLRRSLAKPRRCLAATAASASKRAFPSPAIAQSAFYTEPSISGAALCCCGLPTCGTSKRTNTSWR